MATRVKIRYELDRQWVLAVGVSMAAPHVNRTTERVLSRSKALTPVRTGNLRASQRKTMRARRTYVSGTVETRVKYAHYVHEGTAPHIIAARRRQFLRFVADGQVVFRRVVKHPGTKARPFMRQALLEVAPEGDFKVTGYSVASRGVGWGMAY